EQFLSCPAHFTVLKTVIGWSASVPANHQFYNHKMGGA
ncbi:unnamed protein product, partial [Callosobruchus maculatus]